MILLFFCTQDGYFVGLSASGKIVVETKLSAPSISRPLFLNGKFFLPTKGENFYILSADGKIIKTLKAAPCYSSPVEYEGKVVFFDHLGYLWEIDASTYSIKKKRRVLSSVSTAIPVAERERLIAADWSGKICFLKQGEVAAEASVKGAVYASPVVHRSRIYFSSRDSFVYCYSKAKLRRIWCFKTGLEVVASPFLYRDRLLIGSTDGFLYCINAKKGFLLWKQKLGKIVNSVFCFDNHLYAIGNGYLFCLDVDGKIRWKRKLQATVAGAPFVFKNLLFVSLLKGGVLCFDLYRKEIRWIYKCAKVFSPFLCICEKKLYLPQKAVQADLRFSNSPLNVFIGDVFIADHGNLYSINSCDGSTCWNAWYGGEVFSRLENFHGKILVASTGGTVFLFSVSGKRKWFWHCKGRIFSGPLVYKKNIIIAQIMDENATTVACLKPYKNFPLWEVKVKGKQVSDMLLLKSTLFGFSFKGGMWAIDVEKGRLIFQKEYPANVFKSAPLFLNDSMFIGDIKGKLWRINLNGDVMWSKDLGGEIQTAPVFFSEHVCCFAGNRLFIINPRSGEVVKSLKLPQKVHSKPVVWKGKLVFLDLAGHLWVLTPEFDLELLYNFDSSCLSSLILEENFLLFTLSKGYLVKFDLNRHEPVWWFRLLGTKLTVSPLLFKKKPSHNSRGR